MMETADIICAVFLFIYLCFTLWVTQPSRLLKIDRYLIKHRHNYVLKYINIAITNATAINQLGQFKERIIITANNIKRNAHSSDKLAIRFFLRAIELPYCCVENIIKWVSTKCN